MGSIPDFDIKILLQTLARCWNVLVPILFTILFFYIGALLIGVSNCYNLSLDSYAISEANWQMYAAPCHFKEIDFAITHLGTFCFFKLPKKKKRQTTPM